MINELIDKVSSYNIFNYLLPGAIFTVFIENITNYRITQNDLLVNIFLVYFVGLIISRFGSLVVEPIFKKFINFSNYDDFIKASKSDKKIEVLSEENNVYRTLIALFIILFFIKFYEYFLSNKYDIYVLILLVFVLLIFSYMKQIKYITTRVNNEKSI
jgi:hypothetical protein